MLPWQQEFITRWSYDLSWINQSSSPAFVRAALFENLSKWPLGPFYPPSGPWRVKLTPIYPDGHWIWCLNLAVPDSCLRGLYKENHITYCPTQDTCETARDTCHNYARTTGTIKNRSGQTGLMASPTHDWFFSSHEARNYLLIKALDPCDEFLLLKLAKRQFWGLAVRL